MQTGEEKKYGLDLRRHAGHRKAIPVLMIIKVLLGIGAILLVFYLISQMIDLAEKKQPVNAIEIEQDGGQ